MIIENIKIDNELYEFLELIYKNDRSTLLINKKDKLILSFYKDLEISELWFLIKLNPDDFNLYLSNKIPLSDIINKYTVYFIERTFEDYDNLKKGKILDTASYDLILV